MPENKPDSQSESPQADATKPKPARQQVRKDETLLQAEEVARLAAEELSKPESVGAHVAAKMVAKGVAVHRFECEDAGYPGWQWEVSLARAPRMKTVTVCEVTLAPGEDALLAPEWVPWEERLRPEDISRSDILPYSANDSRLVAGFEQTDPELADAVGVEEIGLGRARVLSAEGIEDAADRWYDSEQGPVTGLKRSETCSTCGFFLKLPGSLGRVFGVCTNEWSPDDGKVVSMDHGCGAHSETDTNRRKPQWPVASSRLDDTQIDVYELRAEN